MDGFAVAMIVNVVMAAGVALAALAVACAALIVGTRDRRREERRDEGLKRP